MVSFECPREVLAQRSLSEDEYSANSDVFIEEKKPVVDYFTKSSIKDHIETIDTSGPIEECAQRFLNILAS